MTTNGSAIRKIALAKVQILAKNKYQKFALCR